MSQKEKTENSRIKTFNLMELKIANSVNKFERLFEKSD